MTLISADRRDAGVKSLNKVLSILQCFSTHERTLSLAEVCARTGYPKSTTHRLLAAMCSVGFLDHDRERTRYRLGLKLFEFGNVVLANMELHREARQHVEALSRMSGHLVHLAVFDGAQAIVIHRCDPAPGGTPQLTHTEAAPVHCTGVGKAILAFQPPAVIDRVIGRGLARHTERTLTAPERLRAELAVTRERGFAIDDGEHQPALRCVGAPLHDAAGRVFAAISASGPARKLAAADLPALAELVTHHARNISAALGYRPGAAEGQPMHEGVT